MKNRVGIIKTRTNQGVSYGGSSLCVEAGPDMPESLNMEKAGLRY
jgi:hypothetical protein